MSSAFVVSAMAVYMAAMVAIGLVLRRQATRSIDDFGLAANRFGSAVIAAVSIGAWVGSAGLIGLCASSYTGGVVSWWSYASLYLVTLPWIFFFVSRLRSLKLFTIAEFYQKRFPGHNGAIQYLVGGGFALKYCMMMGLQFNALAFLFTTVLGWTHVQGVLVSAAIILFYTGISGFLSVMVTNFIQSVFQTLCPFLMLGFVLHSLGGWQPVAQFYTSAGQPQMLSLFQGFGWVKELIYYCITMGLLVIVGNQDDLQRVASAKNDAAAKKGLYLGTFLVLPILLVPCYIGVAARVMLGPDIEPNMVFYTLMMKAGPVMGVLLLYGVLSTIMSWASSTLFAGGMIISKNVIQTYLISRKNCVVTDKQDILLSRVGILLCTIFSIGLSLWFQGIMELMDVVMSICAAALVIPYLFAWFSKRMNTEGAIAGILAGGGTALVWTILGRPWGLDAIWVGLPACLAGCLIGKCFGRAPTEEEIQATYYFQEKFRRKPAVKK